MGCKRRPKYEYLSYTVSKIKNLQITKKRGGGGGRRAGKGENSKALLVTRKVKEACDYCTINQCRYDTQLSFGTENMHT